MTGIFCAIDEADLPRAQKLAHEVASAGIDIKLGLEFFVAHGPSGVLQVRKAVPNARLFLDLKLHDIPNTVAGAVTSALSCGADYITIHTSGGQAMMQAAVQAAQGKIKILGVTVLTALDDDDLQSVGQQTPASAQVMRLAALAKMCGLAGVICSPHEIANLRASHGADFKLVVPGIRPAGADSGDQKRVMTPQEAASLGASDLVIGRPITQAKDPALAARGLLESLALKAA